MTAIRPPSIPAACRCFATAASWAASASREFAPTSRSTPRTRRQPQMDLAQRLPRPALSSSTAFALPFVNQTTPPRASSAGSFTGSFVVGPISEPGRAAGGHARRARRGTARRTCRVRRHADHQQRRSRRRTSTRAVIRLPIGSSARMAIAVADLDGTIIGLYRMADSTVFSVDVAASKARNMVYFSGAARTAADLTGVPMGTAVTNRTIGFGAQPFFPPGIDGSSPGPFFNLYQQDVANPCTQGFQPAGPNQSGVVFFPGSVPLYRNGVLVGGLGVSGDGVDQDDLRGGRAARRASRRRRRFAPIRSYCRACVCLIRNSRRIRQINSNC